MYKTTSGFTIVELLIVTIVIGILAAISIVVYQGIQDGARSSSVQSDLANARKQLDLYKVNQGQYPTDPTGLNNADIKASKTAYNTGRNNFYYCINMLTRQFAIGGATVADKASYMVTSTGSVQFQPSGVNAARVCQAVGLVDDDDVNASDHTGHSTSTGWASWVK